MSSSFNYKKKNRKNNKSTITLDYLHNKKVDSINDNKKKIIGYKKEL